MSKFSLSFKAEDAKLLCRIPSILKDIENRIKSKSCDGEPGMNIDGSLPHEISSVLREAGYEITWKPESKETWIWWGN